jgi:hypothetical protein
MKPFRLTISSVAVVALALSAITGIGVLPAAADTAADGDFTYSFDPSNVSAGATITGYSGASIVVDIPENVTLASKNYAVTTIGEGAFDGEGLTEVSIGTNVTSIGVEAFQNNALKTVSIPDSVTTISLNAFSGNDLATAVLGSGVTTIGAYAFEDNDLTSLTIRNNPTATTTIGAGAFRNNKLTDVTIPDSVTDIGNQAFVGNPFLASLTLGTGVATIGDAAFSFLALTTVTIPNGVTSIGAYAFDDNDLESVTLGTGLLAIGESAFGVNVLKTVTIPNSVTSIGKDAFLGNRLTSVIVGTGVTSIGERAFTSNDSTLTSVLFLGPPPTITPADGGSPSFGSASGKTFYYPQAYAAGYGTTWNGYTATPATPHTSTSTPIIGGTAKIGTTLTAHVNKWSPTSTLNYAWRQVGSSTVLGRNTAYTPTVTDIDKTLIVTVTGYTGTNTASAVASAATTAVARRTFATPPTPLIYGTKQVGKSLTVDPGDWPDDPTLTYLWKRAGIALTGEAATKSRYTVVAGDKGKKLSVTVTGTLPGYTTASATSASTAAVVAGTFTVAPAPTVLGKAQVGDNLTAIPGIWTTGATLTYTWNRSGSTTIISTSADGRYSPVVADIGKTLTVTVTATRNGFTTVRKTSAATAKVIGSPFTTVVPTIDGATDNNTATVGTTLTADPGSWSPTPTTFTYVWKRTTTTNVTTVISGATKDFYKVVATDAGKRITVTITGSKTSYATTSVTSATPGVLIGN